MNDQNKDCVLILGKVEDRLSSGLQKLGYRTRIFEGDAPLPDILVKEVFDVVLINAAGVKNVVDTIQFLRSFDASVDLPILCMVGGLQAFDIKELNLERFEILEPDAKAGMVLGKIATLLRLRKFKGEDERSASLAEMNTRLRDLNAHFKKELEEARHIQASLMPSSLPDDARFQVAVSFQPLEEVGGDWYYVERCPSGAISIQIADVTGHGLSAAFICSMTKLAKCAAGKEVPFELLTEMNRLMAPQMPQGRFVTMGAYLYSPEDGALKFARAGHPPGLLLQRSKNEVLQLKGDGFPVGFFEEAEYSDESAAMGVNDILIVLTDGIPEAQNRSNQTYGMDRISEVLKSSPPEITAVQVLEKILVDFETFVDGRILKDDVTLVALKRTA